MKLLILVFFIVLLTFLVWSPVLQQALIGEGSIYLNDPYLGILNENPILTIIMRHDSQALLFFHLFKDIIGTNLRSYMIILLLGISVVNVSLFFLVRKITNNATPAFISTAFFIANFVGSFEILGLGYYQWFIQRVPNFAITIASLILLIIYLQKKERRIYVASLLIYALSVLLARYSIHMLPLFIFYALFQGTLSLKKGRNKLGPNIALLIPFIAVSYVFYKAQSLLTNGGEINTIDGIVKILPNVFYQLTHLTFPYASVFSKQGVPEFVESMTIPVVIAYLGIAYLVYRKDKKRVVTPFIFSILLSLPLSILLSILLNPIFIPYYSTSRYLYYSSLLSSCFWGISLWFLAKDNKTLKIAFLGVVIIWIFSNKYTLDKNFEEWQRRHDPVIATLNYLKANRDNIDKKTLILVPEEVGNYGIGMFKYLLDLDATLILDNSDADIQADSITMSRIVHIKYDTLSKTAVVETTNL